MYRRVTLLEDGSRIFGNAFSRPQQEYATVVITDTGYTFYKLHSGHPGTDRQRQQLGGDDNPNSICGRQVRASQHLPKRRISTRRYDEFGVDRNDMSQPSVWPPQPIGD